MSLQEACCTCATLLTDIKIPYDPENEKPITHNRTLDCCGRTICAACQYKNRRFETYCPFCQISSKPTALPAEGLRLPPSYNDNDQNARRLNGALPPAYDDCIPPPSHHDQASTGQSSSTIRRPPEDTRDTVHFLSADDSLDSLSLGYHVPQQILRNHNNLYSDSLLAARKFILIPHTHYTGPSLSTPPDPEEEERKNNLRRWMVATKCPDYKVAELYLKGSDGNLQVAVDSFKADEQWERDHPMDNKAKNKRNGNRNGSGRMFGSSGSLAGQLS